MSHAWRRHWFCFRGFHPLTTRLVVPGPRCGQCAHTPVIGFHFTLTTWTRKSGPASTSVTSSVVKGVKSTGVKIQRSSWGLSCWPSTPNIQNGSRRCRPCSNLLLIYFVCQRRKNRPKQLNTYFNCNINPVLSRAKVCIIDKFISDIPLTVPVSL